jgi:serine/threonine protein kinase
MDRIAGKYDIVKLLGEGSSGKVYLVKHSDLGVQYALKVLDPTLSDHQKFIERFKREAEVLIKFTHDGTIHLRDFGRTEDGRYYMAMDFCEGEVLKKIIQKHGRFTVEEALDVVIQILSVLEAAHGLGIIHRDIKPDNVMLEYTKSGRFLVKVVDFGIAKLREAVEITSSVTLEGVSVGTPYYMAPEQASGEVDPDHRVDLYAVGIVLYELLTGVVPFKGKTVLQTLLMHLTHTAEPFADKYNIPEYVQELVDKALQKLKEDRFQSAAEFKAQCVEVIEKYRETAQTKTQYSATITRTSEVKAYSSIECLDGKTKILCLDDNEMILNILKHLLDQQGFTTYTAGNCSAIHDYLFRERVQLLISDVEMPDMRGNRVCQMLKKSLPDLKIILFSNVPERELEKLSQECNADGWISKNWKPTEWLEKINGFLS